MHSLHRAGGCSELKFYILLDCWDAWELGPKLVFRGSDPPLVFFDMCFFACVVNSCSLFIMFMFRKYSWFMQEIVLFNLRSLLVLMDETIFLGWNASRFLRPFPLNVDFGDVYAQASAWNQHRGKNKKTINVFLEPLSLSCVNGGVSTNYCSVKLLILIMESILQVTNWRLSSSQTWF